MICDITPYSYGFEPRTAYRRGSGSFASQYTPEVFSPSAGSHKLFFNSRDPGVYIDKLLIEGC
jgi:hypothetical protein